MPPWEGSFQNKFYDITYFIRATDKVGTLEELPDEIKNTYDRIGVPEAEKSSSVVSAQYELRWFESIHKELKKELSF